ncbi:MAG TPA: O-antigen polymerase [Candidatus Nanoarchaeia archaeon]|nr:O-antigen polymerase [Candidatus Nanoarchaeia archaeon]
MINYALIGATAAFLVAVFLFVFYKTRDSFHPLLITAPMFATLYVYLPASGLSSGRMFSYLSPEQMAYTQLLFLCGVIAFSMGCLHGSLKKRARQHPFQLPDSSRQRLMIGASVLGFLALGAWLITVSNGGGFGEVYSRAYGTGDAESGYVRDGAYLSIPAIVLLLTARLGMRLRLRDVFLALTFSAPMVVHGLLGARRAPIFMAAVALGFGWYMMRHQRPRLVTMLVGGSAVGLLMLVLVSNRENIHLGSDFTLKNDPTKYLNLSTGNEFVYGSAAVIHADKDDSFYWGKRYFTVVFIRPIPSQLWPDKYEAVGMGKLKRNLGIDIRGLRSSVGWEGAVGAAPGLIADLYIEVSWFCLIALYAIGWAYGKVWWLATAKGGFSILLYVLMVALSLYLVMQTFQAMLFRILWMAIPSRLIWSWALAQRAVLTDQSRSQVRPASRHFVRVRDSSAE